MDTKLLASKNGKALLLKLGNSNCTEKILFMLAFSYKNGAFMCSSQAIPWANADFPKKYLKSLFSIPWKSDGTKIWPSALFSPTFYRWMYEYLKNCTTKAQIKNTAHLAALSVYSSKCLNDILKEVSQISFIKLCLSFHLTELHTFFSVCSWFYTISQRRNHAQAAW